MTAAPTGSTSDTSRPSNLPVVHNTRGRPSDYTPEEDAIILKHRNTSEALHLLKQAGFPERTPAALWSRRKYLNEVGVSPETISLLSDDAHAALPGLSAQRRKMQERLRTLDEEREQLCKDIAAISAEMHRLIDGD